MVTRLEELKRERLELPRAAGETFGSIDTTRSRAIVPATIHALTHVRPMEVDDFYDVDGTESEYATRASGQIVVRCDENSSNTIRNSPQKLKACS